MIFFRKTDKPLLFFIVLLLLLQSCSVYQKKSIDLEQASKNGNKTRVTLIDNRKIILKKIEFQDSIYYGSMYAKKGIIRVPLDRNKIKRIQEIDKSASTIVSVAAVTIPVGLLIVVINALAASSDWSTGAGAAGGL